MDRVAFVILHYGDIAVTRKCVNSILNMNQKEKLFIVVVDNEYLKDGDKRISEDSFGNEIPNLTIVKIIENGGFSYANNQGYLYARNTIKADCIVVVNNDIEFVQPDFIERLEESIEDSSFFVIGPKVIKASTGECQNPISLEERSIREVNKTIKKNTIALKCFTFAFPFLFLRDKLFTSSFSREDKLFFEKKHENVVLFGACLIFTPSFVEKETKAFEPETNFYYEEYILAHRCNIKKYGVLYDPSMVVLHEGGVATKTSYKDEKARMKFIMQNIVDSCLVYRSYLEDRKSNQ